MDDDIERLGQLLLAMCDVDVETAEYHELRVQLLREFVRLRAGQNLLERLRPIQDQVDRMGARDPDFDLKSFLDDGWE
ncbi:hypothetical protein [Rhodovulum kholense]|uniref:Uncharacterized protein n=1 Tax=Rhodovulum kholense TaxID=453584 RepID=A0A8E2VG78_9RHOB|nr:hypothetical protein [Rhodovulum kholense]PTW37589.1 hypothetical protein C8N38_1316 [Rhodovulum kholense]